MKLLPAPDPSIELVDTLGCHRDLWDKITFSYLLRWDLLCLPFLWQDRIWTVAMRRPARDLRAAVAADEVSPLARPSQGASLTSSGRGPRRPSRA